MLAGSWELHVVSISAPCFSRKSATSRWLFMTDQTNAVSRTRRTLNYNTNVSQYWEWSGRSLRPFDQTNEAYKLGVSSLICGLTH
jgi:hypothetical protein